jgi:cytochrome c556
MMNNDYRKHEHTNENNESELVALIKYMVNHNTSHTKELSELAEKLSQKNEDEAYDFVKEAISDFKAANKKLSLALEAIMER